MKTRIGFDMTRVSAHCTGIEYFALTALRAAYELLPQHPNWQLYVLGTPDGLAIIRKLLDGPLHPQLSLYPVHEGKGWLKEQLYLPWALCQLPRLDLLYSPGYPISPFAPARRTLLQVHDMVPWHRADTMTSTARLYWRMTLPTAIRRASQVLVDSEFTGGEIMRQPFARNKSIRVMHPAVAAHYNVTPDRTVVNATLEMLGVKRPYLITCGSLEPRKNLTFLLDVFDRYLESTLHANINLVITGGRGWKNSAFHQKLAACRCRERVQLLGWLPSEQLVHLIVGAEALLYPSLYEGFGLPPLEALALGTPAIVSDVTSIPEIMGPCGLYGDPHDTGRWVELIEQVIGNQPYRAQVAVEGKAWASRYSEAVLKSALEQVLLDVLS